MSLEQKIHQGHGPAPAPTPKSALDLLPAHSPISGPELARNAIPDLPKSLAQIATFIHHLGPNSKHASPHSEPQQSKQPNLLERGKDWVFAVIVKPTAEFVTKHILQPATQLYRAVVESPIGQLVSGTLTRTVAMARNFIGATYEAFASTASALAEKLAPSSKSTKQSYASRDARMNAGEVTASDPHNPNTIDTHRAAAFISFGETLANVHSSTQSLSQILTDACEIVGRATEAKHKLEEKTYQAEKREMDRKIAELRSLQSVCPALGPQIAGLIQDLSDIIPDYGALSESGIRSRVQRLEELQTRKMQIQEQQRRVGSALELEQAA